MNAKHAVEYQLILNRLLNGAVFSVKACNCNSILDSGLTVQTSGGVEFDDVTFESQNFQK